MNTYIYSIDNAISQEEYEKSLDRIKKFNNKSSEITFIIPTIGRTTLINTLRSIVSQTSDNWKCIIIYDNCYPSNDILEFIDNDSRFLYIIVQKQGKRLNNSGNVRNIGMSLIDSGWVGFVDDDDIISDNYIECFMIEKTNYSDANCIIFKMCYEQNNRVLPIISDTDNISSTLYVGNVGISFCYNIELFKKNYIFIPCDWEDCDLILRMYNDNVKIVLSQYITYLIRSNNKDVFIQRTNDINTIHVSYLIN